MTFFKTTALAILSALFGGASGQAQSAANQVMGEVTAVAAQSGQILLKTDKGEAVTVTVNAGTAFRRVPPGAQDLTKAASIALSDLGVGDRILAIGQKSDDQKSVVARS